MCWGVPCPRAGHGRDLGTKPVRPPVGTPQADRARQGGGPPSTHRGAAGGPSGRAAWHVSRMACTAGRSPANSASSGCADMRQASSRPTCAPLSLGLRAPGWHVSPAGKPGKSGRTYGKEKVNSSILLRGSRLQARKRHSTRSRSGGVAFLFLRRSFQLCPSLWPGGPTALRGLP